MIRTAQKAPKKRLVEAMESFHRQARELGLDELDSAPEKQKPGPKPSGRAKQTVTLRIDQDVVAAYKATGPGWLTRMADVLRDAKPRGSPRPYAGKED